jgi:DNA repair exonuclease SbcCD nuclease subunit
MGVRFVHASDLHLDASFGGVNASDDAVAGAFARSTLEALERVVALCIEREADFLVIAGDLHNSADRSLRGELAFQRAMRRLADRGIPAFVVQGNHDPADGWSAGLELPDSVVIFSSREVERREVHRNGEVVCAVYGRSFPTRQVTDNLALEYRRQPDDPLAVAVLHTNVGQLAAWDNYAPSTVDDLRAANMDYWALGHIHVPGRISDNPVAVYSGSTQGLNPNEEGPRGCFVVELDAAGAREEFVDTASIRWNNVELDGTALTDVDELRAAVSRACDVARGESGGRPVVVRADLTGRSVLHTDLGRAGFLSDLLSDLRDEQLGGDPWIWIDRLRDRTRPHVDLEAVAAEEGLRGDLLRLAARWSGDVEASESMIDELVAPLLAQLPGQWQHGLSVRQIIERASDLCIDRLSEDD